MTTKEVIMGKEKVFKSRNKNLNVFVITLLIILLVYTVSMIIPIVWGFYTSFKHWLEFKDNVVGLPDLTYWSKYGFLDPGYDHIFANYVIIVQNFQFKRSVNYYVGFVTQTLVRHEAVVGIGPTLVNTFMYCAGCCILPTFMSLLGGYMCAKYRYKFSTFIYGFEIFTMVMPIVGTMPAIITLTRQLGFYDEFYGHWIRQCNMVGTYFLIFYAFYMGLSDTYIEAAEIDGASQIRVIVSIIVPLARTTLSTVMVLMFVSAWNDYNTPLIYLPTKPTIAYAIFYMTTTGITKYDRVPIRVATLMLLCIPILVFFTIFKNKLMGNVSMGGIKE